MSTQNICFSREIRQIRICILHLVRVMTGDASKRKPAFSATGETIIQLKIRKAHYNPHKLFILISP